MLVLKFLFVLIRGDFHWSADASVLHACTQVAYISGNKQTMEYVGKHQSVTIFLQTFDTCFFCDSDVVLHEGLLLVKE